MINRVVRGGKAAPGDAIYQQSLNLVLSVIAAASLGQEIPKEFPRQFLPFFDRFGSSLEAGERIEFPSSQANGSPIVYDQDTRHRLVRMSGGQATEKAAIVGRIVEVNAAQNTFTFGESWSLKTIKAKLPREFVATAIGALSEFHQRQAKVLFRGLVQFSDTLDLEKIIEVHHIEVLDENDVPLRLECLGKLEAGWLDGQGEALSGAGLSILSNLWIQHFPDDLPSPHTYPRPDGGVEFEWTTERWEISATVNLRAPLTMLVAQLHAAPLDGGEVRESSVPLADHHGWQSFAAFIREIISNSDQTLTDKESQQ